MTRVIDIRHPLYRGQTESWRKWRLTYEGGECFLDEYLKKFSKREEACDFTDRKAVTPIPAFAKSSINDIKNSIFQRLSEIVRRGGSDVYQKAVRGQENGVDLHGTAMNTYIGREVLPELLTMARVGIYVDAPPLAGVTLADQQGNHPYLYTYKTEEILSWVYRADRVNEFQSVLLRDWVDDCCTETGLPMDQWCRYRHIWIDANGKVNIQCYDDDCEHVDLDGNINSDGPIVLDIDRIPFVILEITDSLLADVANHQIALLNLESSDVSYILKAGHPFYVEQQDMLANNSYLRQPAEGGDGSAVSSESKDREMRVGAVQGRVYGKDLDAPSFINPSSEPVKASMDKQKALKEDIRMLVNLALSNIQPKMASAESKSFDERGLEAGLSYIGLELEHAERMIASYWAMYENNKSEITVAYPKKYSLQTDDSKRKDVEALEKLRDSVPSEAYQKSISKQMALTLLGDKLSTEELDKIFKEIDKSECYTANPEIIFPAIEHGVMSLDIAAKLLGLPKESVAAAAKDHAERAARVAAAQAKPDPAARGNTEGSANLNAGKEEKKASTDTTGDDTPGNKQRGEGK